MDPRNSSPLFPERPIVLTPPPLDQHTIAANLKSTLGGLLQLQPDLNQNPPYHGNRQQSVGYNLQHEFETLTADLDLDLTQNPHQAPAAIKHDGPVASPPATSKGFGGHGLLAPSASGSKYGFMDLNSASLLDQSISPVPKHPTSSLLLNANGGHSSGSFLPPLGNTIPSRPQSVNDFLNFFGREQQRQLALEHQEQLANNFYTDLLNYSNWIENLSPQDTITMIEYLCNNLPLDILLTFKSKLDNHLIHHQQPAPPQAYNQVVSPFQQPQLNHDYVHDLENLSLDQSLSHNPDGGLYQPKPNKGNFRHHLFADVKTQRPKSADPSIHTKYNQRSPPHQQLPHGYHHGQKELDRARSPTSHLYEKTNFLQLAAGNKKSPTNGHSTNGAPPSNPTNLNQPAGPAHLSHSNSTSTNTSNSTSTNNPANSDESLDMSAALKLGALATINSRVALDSSRKNHGGYYHPIPQQQQQQQTVKNPHYLNATYAESINRALNSSSVPATNSKHHQVVASVPSAQSNLKSTPAKKSDSGSSQNQSLPSNGSSSMPPETSNIELLKNIPAWLKLLRLHKYTDCLKDIYWKELIELNDAQLEDKGVKALGARRKLLKAFDAVKASNSYGTL